MNIRNTIGVALLILALPGWLNAAQKTSVFNTKHNLSSSGRGDITAASETRVCIFCHSSHNASKEGPLWNH